MQRTKHDVFLSYSSDDRAAVDALALRLVRENIQPWLDTWNLIPGEPWQESIEIALDSCASCAVFIGPGGTSPWQNEEMRAALDRRVAEGWQKFRVIPVLLPGAERGERGRLPAFLTANTWVEFRQTLDDENAFRRLLAGIRGVEPGIGDGNAAYEGETPYRGLHSFDIEDSRFFFGREALVEWMIDALQPARGARPGNRFLAVIGPSGSGKSSLARAGLVAQLHRGAIAGSAGWPVAICTPTVDPLESLAVALLTATGEQVSLAALRDLIRDLQADRRTLHQWVRLRFSGAPGSQRLFLLVDQFEEFFTLCDDEQSRQAALENLLHAATITGGQTIVVLTLRADFYGKCAAYPSLAAALSDNQMLIGPMSGEELRRTIERPAYLVGCEFEPGLVETLLQAVGGQPGTLPLLQHALLELWNRRSGRRLTHTAYREINGVAGAIERHAETVFSRLEEHEQLICRRILLRLTQPGEGTEDTRRRATIGELVPQADMYAEVTRVVTILADARLVTTSMDSQSKEQIVDVSHEALIGGWPRLQQWIAEDRAGLLIHRRLTSAAAEWQRLDEDEGAVFRGARLAEVLEWQRQADASLNELERRFIAASCVVQERETSAARQRQTESNRKLTTGARAQVAVNPELSILLAKEAVRITQTPEAEDTLREALLTIQPPRLLAGHVSAVVRTAFSPDSRYLVSASWDSTAIVWETFSGSIVRRLTGYPGTAPLVAFTHHSMQHSWQLDEIRLISESKGHTGPLTGCWFSPNRQLVLTTGRDRVACTWRLTSAAEAPLILAGHTGRVCAGAFSPDGQIVASADTDGSVRLWNPATGACIGVLNRPRQRISHIAFDATGRSLASAGADGTAYVWDVRTLTMSAELRGHGGAVEHLAFHPTAPMIGTVGQDGAGRLWNLRTAECVIELRGQQVALSQIGFSPDGRLVITASAEGTVRLWSVETGVIVGELRGHSGAISSLAIHPGGRFIATASQDGSGRLWNLSTGQSIGALHGHTGPVNHIVFSPNGELVATSGQDGTVRLYDCRVCNADDLLVLAGERVVRDLTDEEREQYL